MVRGGVGVGPFNTDFNIKFIFAIIVVLLILFDWKKNDRLDYFWVSVFGTIIWSTAEFFLQLSGTREFQQNYLFGIPLPLFIAIPFQGLVEGAFIAVICLFFADLMKDDKNKKWAIIGFTILMVLLFIGAFLGGIHEPNYGGDVPSRRKMTSIISLFFLGVFIYANITFFLIKPKSEESRIGKYLKIYPTDKDRKRGEYLFLFMTVFGTVWTIAEYLAGTRWIEIGTIDSTEHAPPLVEFFWLTFDIIIEITVAYIPFYTLPLGLKLIKSEK
ncbi:MAG: hypothetical protein ACTSPD_14490 [Promethearchaeota archaeon]